MSEKLKIERVELVRILNAVKPGLASKEVFDQATHFIFSGTAVMTYNEKICVQVPLTTPFSCSVMAEKLLKVINNAKKDKELELWMHDGHLCIKGKHTNLKLNTETQSKGALEMIEALGQQRLVEAMIEIPKDFLQGIDLARFSCAKDDTSDNFHCVCITESKLQACDEWRLSRYIMVAPMTEPGEQVLLPASTIRDLLDYTIHEFIVQEGWIHFLCDDGAVFSAVTSSGEFQSVDDAISGQEEGNVLPLPKELSEILDDAALIAEGSKSTEKEVRITIKEGKLECFSQNKDFGELTKTIEMDTTEEAEFTINPYFLKEVLKHIRTIELNSSVAMFKTENFIHIISTSAMEEGEE